nr:serine hydrolase [Pararhodobacter oceanensis]
MSVAAQPFASVIMDVRTGEILRSRNSTARLHPASLTKMMTLYIAFEAVENGEISLDTRVRISAHAASQPPSRLGLRAGQTISFRYLIRAAALRSANDAAAAIAEAVEGSVPAFARRMNRTALAIGMTRTNFRNPHGLTQEGHLSTARDMSMLGRQLYFDFPQYYNLFSRRSESAGIATVRNTNRRFLNGYRGADGLKTGFTSAAGYNLTAMAERENVRILVTVMGARSSTHRFEQVVSLMDTGFRRAPSRAATRRPDRPDYARLPEDSGSGVPAGRVIRLQTAPTSSRFPQPRPQQPDEAPPEALIAALRDEIDGVIDEIRAPDEPDLAAAALAEAAVEAASESAAESTVTEVAHAETADADLIAEAVAVATSEATPDEAAAALAALAVSPIPAQRPEVIVESVAATRSEANPNDSALALASLSEDANMVADVAQAPPLIDSAPVQFEHTPEAIAAVGIENGRVAIPGLPPITLDIAAAEAGSSEASAADTPAIATTALPEQPAEITSDLPPAPALEPAEGALLVGDDGRILWRDEELLAALADEIPSDPVLSHSIVLTTSAQDDPAPEPPMPEIVTRVSTSGGRVWAVEVGSYGSRFDAERVLLRLALSESATLGTGVRRVSSQRGGWLAEVHSLSEEQAALACTRLTARDRPCTVVAP